MAALMVSGAVRFKIHRVPTEKLGRHVLEKDDEDEEEEEEEDDEYMCIPEDGKKVSGLKSARAGRRCIHTELRRRVRAY